MGDMGQIRDTTKFNYEHDGIYAFKPKPFRFLAFFFEGKKIIVTHAFKKQQQKLPRTEKERAMLIKKEYETRVKRGDYYE
jgi:phage-related protein